MIRTKIIHYAGVLLLVTVAACTDRDILESKPGVSLPPVTGLSLSADTPYVELSWKIPAGLPEEIQQPVDIYVEVNEILSPTRAVRIFSTVLPEAPTSFSYQLPDALKKYHLTVKVHGRTKTADPNYSGEIYSEGQTVVYEP